MADEVNESTMREEGLAEGDLILDLDGFEGPIDVLLALARDQKVDLARISILELADQYLAFVQRARRLRIELAADYLVMAAWLAYLKSRLLLPEPAGAEEPSGPALAEALAFQLQRLEAMQQSGKRLMARPQQGIDFFGRGAPEPVSTILRPVYQATLYDLLKAYGRQRARIEASSLQIVPSDLYSMDDALRRLGQMLGTVLDWQSLSAFLPPGLASGVVFRSAIASTFAASLELARAGRLQLRQDRTFGPIFLKPASGNASTNDADPSGAHNPGPS
jgi:segregation and condensation protein A